jgi:outer membrane protein OmpA-like peptidoglycan-associated protein
MSTPDPSRERVEQLIAVADRVAQRPPPPPRSRLLPVAMLAAGGLVAVVIGVKLASGGDSSSIDSGQTTAVPTAVTTIAPSTTIPMVITLPPTSPPTTTTEAPSTTAPPTTTPTAVDPAAPVRSVQFTGGRAYLMGTVPDQATADRLFSIAAAVVGAENVVLDYTIAADSPLPESEPVYFPDSFRFAPNSADLTPADVHVLDLVMVFMVQNPQVTLDVLGFTDSVGAADYNQQLSQARVDAIRQYLVVGGLAPERVTAIGMGAADPVASNDTPEGRAENRRVEFVVHHLLG